MQFMIDHPRLPCVACVVAMWAMARLGAWLRVKLRVPEKDGSDNILLVPATPTPPRA
jgi:hypothetical protein